MVLWLAGGTESRLFLGQGVGVSINRVFYLSILDFPFSVAFESSPCLVLLASDCQPAVPVSREESE